MLKKSKRLRNHATLLRCAGWSYLLLAILYPVFALSSLQLGVENGNLSDVLISYTQSSSVSFTLMMFFTFVPILLVFGGVGFYSALKPYAYKLSSLSLASSGVAAFGFLLGIGRWSSLNWGLGKAFEVYKEQSDLIANIYQFSNYIVGFWVGHLIAEISFFVAIGFMSFAMYYSKRFPLWLCGFGALVFILGFSSVFRFSGNALLAQGIHEIMNYLVLVPLFFVFLSIGLFRFSGKPRELPLVKHPKKKKVKKEKVPSFNKKLKASKKRL